jgi:hypothetical protein
MIQYLTNNYRKFKSDTKSAETEYQIQRILTTNWCEATDDNGTVTLTSCGSKPIQLNSYNLTQMLNHLKSNAKAD